MICGLLGAAGVGLGAFGAHGLESTLATRATTQVWQTAVFYHLLHAVAALAVSLHRTDSRRAQLAVWGWIAGIVLFSGSLYALALGGPRVLGPVTPVGGVAFITGWLLVAFAPRPRSGQL